MIAPVAATVEKMVTWPRRRTNLRHPLPLPLLGWREEIDGVKYMSEVFSSKNYDSHVPEEWVRIAV